MIDVKPFCDYAIRLFGANNQIDKSIEELSELIQALIHRKHKRPEEYDRVAEEIADVMLMLEQLKIVYGIPQSTLDRIISDKIQRVYHRYSTGATETWTTESTRNFGSSS